VDEVHANMLGWRTKTLTDIRAKHLKHTGAADGAWRDAVKNGRGRYLVGYHPLFIGVNCFSQLFKRPPVIRSFGICFGYLSGYFNRVPRFIDRKMIHYLRSQQMRRLFGRETIWK
jgi:hypothetical protein